MVERRLIQNICPQTPKRVKGRILKKLNVEEVEGEVPAGTVICAGSLVELTDAQEKELEGLGALGEGNFGLDQVFTQSFMLFNKKLALWQILNAYGIYTLEQVLENAKGYEPLKGDPLPAQDILRLYGKNESVVEIWLNQVKAKLGL